MTEKSKSPQVFQLVFAVPPYSLLLFRRDAAEAAEGKAGPSAAVRLLRMSHTSKQTRCGARRTHVRSARATPFSIFFVFLLFCLNDICTFFFLTPLCAVGGHFIGRLMTASTKDAIGPATSVRLVGVLVDSGLRAPDNDAKASAAYALAGGSVPAGSARRSRRASSTTLNHPCAAHIDACTVMNDASQQQGGGAVRLQEVAHDLQHRTEPRTKSGALRCIHRGSSATCCPVVRFRRRRSVHIHLSPVSSCSGR